MELPVHGKTCKHIFRTAFCTRSDLLIHILIFIAYRIICLLCLCQNGIIIVGYLGDSIGRLIDDMAYLMGNSPAKKLSAHIFSIITFNRYTACKAAHTAPFDTHMKPAGIHKGSGKHSHVTYVQTAGRQIIFAAILGSQCLVSIIITQSFVLVKQCHHLFHSLTGLI